MEFGKLDIILKVEDLGASIAFYGQLGFEVLESGDGLVVIRHELLTLVLMQGHVRTNMFNFRPPDISRLLPELKRRFPSGKELAEGQAFEVRDPDGNTIYVCQDH